MSNILKVAKKEFVDLLNSKLVMITIVLFSVILLLTLYNLYIDINNSRHGISDINGKSNPVIIFLSILSMILCYYGSLVGIAIGYASITSELDNRAINTLLSKPLYRDTIINGKMLGVFGFLNMLFLLILTVYILFIVTIFNFISLDIFSFLSKIALPYVLFNLYLLIFFTLTLLFCIVIKERSFALFLSFIVWILSFVIIPNVTISWYLPSFLALVFNNPSLLSLGDIITNLSLNTILTLIFSNVTDSMTVKEILDIKIMEFLKLIVYYIIALYLTYTFFIKEDIQ